jgi:homoserine dehydrogenase
MKAVEKVEAHIADVLKKGAKVVTAGKRAARKHEGRAAASSSRRY